MTQWYYAKARLLENKHFLGWIGASTGGALEFLGGEEQDPSKIDRVLAVGMDTHDDGTTYLRAPAYHAHGSASLGGSGDDGYYAAWKWGETRGYPVKQDGRGVIVDNSGRVLSSYLYAGKHEASWEKGEGQALIIEFARPA